MIHFLIDVVKDTATMLSNNLKMMRSEPKYFKPALNAAAYKTQLLEVYRRECIEIPPVRTRNGERVIIYRMPAWDPDQVLLENIFKTRQMILLA